MYSVIVENIYNIQEDDEVKSNDDRREENHEVVFPSVHGEFHFRSEKVLPLFHPY